MTENPRNSAWEDSYATERKRQVANQGGARDAKRRIARHQNANTRNPNRTVVSSYSNRTPEQTPEFNAVAPESRHAHRRSNGSSFGERNARATWSSSSSAGFPNSRKSASGGIRRLIVPVIVLIVVFVVIVLIIRSCVG